MAAETELLSVRLEGKVGDLLSLLDAEGLVRQELAETIYSLERAAAVAWELEDRRLEHSSVEGVNEELRQQAAAFAAILLDLHGTFAAADSDTAQRIAARIRAALTSNGIEVP